MSKEISPQRQAVADAFNRLGGNITAVARELKLSRSTVQYHIRKLGGIKKPLVGGTIKGVTHTAVKLPPPGEVKRYIVTSAQNNTAIHDKVWANLLALAQHYNAKILIGTYSYNKNAFGPLAVKKGTFSGYDRELWYAPELEPYICDKRLELANGLVWCGEMNIIPTAENPLEGLETYSGRKSAIFPHAKLVMRSIATMKDEGTKFNYTTGTVTKRNYLQKKAGLKAEHHHVYGGLLVEVNSRGNWWVRQLDADSRGRIQDLDVVVDNGQVTTGNRVEAITWGDLHSTVLDPTVKQMAIGKNGMLDTLQPKFQFIHDLLEGVSINHHSVNDPHEKFKAFMRGFDTVENELQCTAEVLKAYDRVWAQTVVVDSNHDNWLKRWLREHDYRKDPRNALIFLQAQSAVYEAIREGKDDEFNLTEWAMRRFPFTPAKTTFLRTDESFKICGKKIECGMHGHLGPDGARGSEANLSKVGRKAIIGHTHSAGIYNGLYVAGVSCKLNVGYNKGPSSWSHSHVVTYPNGKRTIITMFAGQWKA